MPGNHRAADGPGHPYCRPSGVLLLQRRRRRGSADNRGPPLPPQLVGAFVRMPDIRLCQSSPGQYQPRSVRTCRASQRPLKHPGSKFLAEQSSNGVHRLRIIGPSASSYAQRRASRGFAASAAAPGIARVRPVCDLAPAVSERRICEEPGHGRNGTHDQFGNVSHSGNLSFT